MPIKEEKPFNLLRWFSLLSFISICLITVVSALLLSRFLANNILYRDAVVTMEFVQSIAQTENTRQYFEATRPGGGETVFEDFFKRIATMPEVVRANVYARDGTVIWSNDDRFIGHQFNPDPHLQMALSGNLAINSGKSSKPLKAEHVLDRDIPYFAEIYIPIWNQAKDQVAGVVKVYKMPATLFNAIARGNWLVWGSAIIGGLFLYLSLFWIVRRASFVIQEQHERQVAIAKENSKLSRRLNLKIDELTHLQAQLIQTEKLSAIGELVSGVAHELNNPLTSIIGFSELLLKSPHSAPLQKQLNIIQSEAVRCSRIIQSMLAFARAEKFTLKETDLHALLEKTLEIKSHHFAMDGIEVHLEFEKELPFVSADGNQIQQVFMNIINNAHQAMKEQKGERKLIIKGTREDTSVRLIFQDTGPGISKEIMPKIFNPFFTTKPVGIGTGLGLSVSYGIVKAHGGNLFAESKIGRGTAIYVELPIHLEEPLRQDPIPEEEPAPQMLLSGKRLLVVDDETFILEMIQEILSSQGAEVVGKGNGPEALEALRRESFDLVLSDIKMPGMDGLQFYQAVIDEKPYLKNKVVFLTGDTMNEETRRFFKDGNHPFLNKPFEIKDLLDVVLKSTS